LYSAEVRVATVLPSLRSLADRDSGRTENERSSGYKTSINLSVQTCRLCAERPSTGAWLRVVMCSLATYIYAGGHEILMPPRPDVV